MKKGFLFMAITAIALLFTACEDELDKSGNAGGGKDQEANARAVQSQEDQTTTNYSDSLFYYSNKSVSTE